MEQPILVLDQISLHAMIHENPKHIRLLMADDDTDDLELMASAFREAGFSSPIRTFTDGCSLMEYLQTDPGDSATLVMLDLNMPKRNGKSILDQIRHCTRLSHLSVIVYSTSSAREDIEEAYQLGCNAYVIKPNCYREICRIAAGIKRLWFGSPSLIVTG